MPTDHLPANFATSTERVAWVILQALHENIPEDKRPMSWSDLSEEQAVRIKIAAQRAISETLIIHQELNDILTSNSGARTPGKDL